MKRFQIAKKFFQEYGAPMLHKNFAVVENLIQDIDVKNIHILATVED